MKDWHFHTDWIESIPAARWSRGDGHPVLLVHGIGPGTTGLANFAPLLDSLVERWEVHLIDLIGFGRSGRKSVPPFFDTALWLKQVTHVIKQFGDRPAAVIGNSVGGSLALKAAVRLPSLRVAIAIGAPAERYPIPPVLQAFWSVPRSAEDLALALAPMTAAQARAAPALVAARFAAFDDLTYRDYGRCQYDQGRCQPVALGAGQRRSTRRGDGPRSARISDRARRCGLRCGNAGRAQVHLARRSSGAMDGRQWRARLLCLLHQFCRLLRNSIAEATKTGSISKNSDLA
jgi:pimeloyl-ACP methyl ester carboxylesterase